MPNVNPEAARPFRSLIGLILVFVIGIMGFTALGIWQLERRVWKLKLIAQVDQNIHAAPVAAPGPDAWGALAPPDAYRRVTVHGQFLNDHETAVQTVTVKGSGYWIMTPLQTDEGFIVLVNRGFVPADKSDASTRLAGLVMEPATVTGLLRLSEPRGRFLRLNLPKLGRWYSRDVAAMAEVHRLPNVASYFIDADDTPNAGGWPIGGLTAINFPNNHLIYAITWFMLALMMVYGCVIVVREELRQRGLRRDQAA